MWRKEAVYIEHNYIHDHYRFGDDEGERSMFFELREFELGMWWDVVGGWMDDVVEDARGTHC